MIGDTVLLEPIARQYVGECEEVYIRSPYPEVLANHPDIISLGRHEIPPKDTVIVDMNDAIDPVVGTTINRHKVSTMYEAAGLSPHNKAKPQLYLSVAEQEMVEEVRRGYKGRKVGVVLESNHPPKNWTHIEEFIARATKQNNHVFVFAKESATRFDWIDKYAVVPVFGHSLREVISIIRAMDVMVGADTGLMHIAGALDVPMVVIGFECFADHYEQYADCRYISVPMRPDGMSYCSARRAMRAIGRVSRTWTTALHVDRADVALFRLDGMGGTVTLTDHAKKIYDATGKRSVVIVRGHAALFQNNPHISDVVEVGYVRWDDALSEMLPRYNSIAEIRFAPAKWHKNGRLNTAQTLGVDEGLFKSFPHECRQLEKYKLHHVQLTDRYLGLPHDSIDMTIYCDERYDGALPDKFLLCSNGVDVQHRGLKQTKLWDGWEELIPLLPLPLVQVGTDHDAYIHGAIDLRGQTSLPQLFNVIKRAAGIVCTEGGIMHLGYALDAPNVFVIRGPTRGKLFEYPGHHFIDSYICEVCWSSTDEWYAHCPKHLESACMKSITPERVAMNIAEVLL